MRVLRFGVTEPSRLRHDRRCSLATRGSGHLDRLSTYALFGLLAIGLASSAASAFLGALSFFGDSGLGALCSSALTRVPASTDCCTAWGRGVRGG